jgi:hypothetical protein
MASDVPPPQMGWLEQQFANTNIVILVIFGICCSGIAAIIAAIAYFTGTNPKAKQNALIVMIIGAIVAVMGGGINCFGGGMNMFNR